MRIDRCVCIDTTFEDLARTARDEGLDLPGLSDATGCCRGCALCEPYVAEALRSGRVVFHAREPIPAPPHGGAGA